MANRGDAVGGYYRDFMNGFKPSAESARQQAIYQMHLRSLIEVACNRFKWEGLPDTVNLRFLELTLFRDALAVIYQLPDNDEIVAVQGTGSGVINMNQEPTSFTVVGPGMKSKEVSAKAVTPIWANYMRIPDWDIVEIYARRIADVERTIEINALNARRTKVVVHDINTDLSMTNFDRQLKEGASTIKVMSDDISKGVTALDMGIDTKSLVDLSVLRSRYINDVFAMLGINGANQDKKERLVADEVNANDDQVMSRRFVALNARRLACEDMNKKFGLNVSVEFNVEVEAQAKEALDNGNIHDESKESD